MRSSNWRTELTYPKELVEWAASRPEADFITLWEENIDPNWLHHLAKAGGATKQDITIAACGVARLCLHLIPKEEIRPRIAIETAEAWARGEATEGQVIEDSTSAYIFINLAYSAASPSTYYAAQAAASSATYSGSTVSYAALAGIESQLICHTYRKHLVFERPPRPKVLTFWQHLAKEEE